MKPFTLGRGAVMTVSLGIFMMLCTVLPGLSLAQDPTAKESAAEAAQDKAAAYPKSLDDPSIDFEELRLRLIPLTVDQLGSLAEAWQEHARAATQTAVDKSLEIRAAKETDKEALLDERLALLDKRRLIFEKFFAVVSSFEKKSGDPAKVSVLRGYISAINSEEKSQLTFQEFTDSLQNWLASRDGGVGLAFRIIVIAASLFGLFIFAKIVSAWARLAFNRIPNLSKLLSSFLVMSVYWLTIAFGLMVVLAALGVNITPLFALVGGASFIIAFALQETLGNLAAGLMIMINRPFDEGDYVLIAGLGGTVKHVSVVSTTVATPDNQVIMIPNSKVWGDVITNVTASDTRRVDLVFGISYSDSIEQAQKTLEEIVAGHPLVLKDPAPMIRVNELADSSVNFIVRPWANTGDYWTVFWDLQRTVKEEFDARGISIPFPQTDMHLHVVDGGKSSDSAVAGTLTQEGKDDPRGPVSYSDGDYGADETAEDGNERG